jgi:hypothetical protein
MNRSNLIAAAAFAEGMVISASAMAEGLTWFMNFGKI